MSFSLFEDEDGDFVVIDKQKLPSGMTVEIQFELYDLTNVSVANVFLNVYKKKETNTRKYFTSNWKRWIKTIFLGFEKDKRI